MFKHILVPLDGSELAEAALPAAAYLAVILDAKVTLVHVIEKNAPKKVHGQPHLKNPREAELYLRDVSQRGFPVNVQVNRHVHTAEVDNVAESIVEHKDELDFDLIVMCSHGRGKALHLFLGSIAQKIIFKGSKPVLVTHPLKHGEPPSFSCQNILVPLDGEPDHSKALPISKELARRCGAHINLLTVVPSFGTLTGERTVMSRFLPGTMSKMLEISVEHAREFLQQTLDELRSQGFSASAQVLRGDPGNVIVDDARRSGIQLIVLGTHGRFGMDAFWEGSVTHKVCSQSNVPILLIPVKKLHAFQG